MPAAQRGGFGKCSTRPGAALQGASLANFPSPVRAGRTTENVPLGQKKVAFRRRGLIHCRGLQRTTSATPASAGGSPASCSPGVRRSREGAIHVESPRHIGEEGV